MTPNDKLDLQVAEEQDGSAVVTLPAGDALIDNGNTNDDQNNDSDAQDEHLNAQNNDQNDGDDGLDDDPERDAIRAARREERKLKKQIHREKARESNHLINALKKQNQDLAARLAAVEQKTSGAELARVDKAIDDANVQVEFAKMKMKDAVTTQDGEGVAKAEELLYDARRKLESLQNIKQQATRQTTQPRQNIQPPDPVVQRYATDWMKDNAWYDPQGRDLDSQITQRIDKQLSDEGYDPTTEEYWEILNDQVQKYLPHRKNTGYNDSNVRNQRPRAIVTGSGRDSSSAAGKPNEFRLSPDRVAAIKEAGMWDNPELRQKAIRNYAQWDRTNKNQRS